MGHVVLSGNLWKMKRQPRNIFQQWNNRYFTIENFCLKWRSGPEKIESGSIPLSHISEVRSFESGGKGAHRYVSNKAMHMHSHQPHGILMIYMYVWTSLFSFIVDSKERSLLLRAESESDKIRWIKALEMQIDLSKGGDGDGMISGGMVAVSRHKKKVDTSLETEIDKKMVLLNEVEKIDKQRQRSDIRGRPPRDRGEEKYDHRNATAEERREVLKYTSHSNDVITLDENDISRDSF